MRRGAPESGRDLTTSMAPERGGSISILSKTPSAAAKVVRDFKKDNEKLKVKAGVLEGHVLDAKGVEDTLANMPGKDEARAMLLAQLIAPAQRFVMLLNAPAREMVGVLAAKQRKDEG